MRKQVITAHQSISLNFQSIKPNNLKKPISTTIKMLYATLEIFIEFLEKQVYHNVQILLG